MYTTNVYSYKTKQSNLSLRNCYISSSMKKLFLIIFLSVTPLFATSIDINKKAIYLGVVKNATKAKLLSRQYKDNFIYFFKIVQNNEPCFEAYLVNIKKTNFKTLLKRAKQDNSESKELSGVKLKYFAKLNSKNSKKSKNKLINKNKKAIFLSCKATLDEAKILANKYRKFDIYIYSTIKNDEDCYAVYIVNIENKKFKSLLSSAVKIFQKAKEISKAKIKYFSKDRSPKNKLIVS